MAPCKVMDETILETWMNIDYICILKASDVILLNGNSKVMDEQFVKHR
jgi:hypothetical protein